MRAEFTWYPGNPIASIQMLGTQEDATTINGMWKDRFLKTTTDSGLPVFGQTAVALYEGAAVRDVSDLAKVVDGFRMRGQLLEVKWDEITRHGIMTQFEQTWQRREDLEWSIEFQWSSRGELVLPVGFGTSLSIVDIINKILNAVQALLDAVQVIKDAFAMVASIINLVNNAIDAIADAAAELSSMAQQFVNLAMSGPETFRKVISTLETFKDEAQSIVSAFQSIPARAQRAVTDVSTVTQEQAIDSEEKTRKARLAARKLQREAARQQQEMLANSYQQATLAAFVAREGQDLRDVSSQYYGTANEWRRLATYNHISGSRLHAGTVVLVPKLGTEGT
jgi:nucleoid-associated protein YgaU